MLKKTGILFITLLYLSTVPGFALNFHYCFNTLTSVSVDAPAKACNPAAAKMKCCRNKRIEVKINDAHQTAPHIALAKVYSLQLPGLLFGDCSLTAQKFITTAYFDRGPPGMPLIKTSIFIKNRVFRI